MTLQECQDKLIRACDSLKDYSLMNLQTGESIEAAFGVEFDTTDTKVMEVLMVWFKMNIPVGIKLYEVDGKSYFQVRRDHSIKSMMVYLLKDYK